MTPSTPPSSASTPRRAHKRLHMGVLLLLQGIMAVELLALLWQSSWMSAVWLLVIMAVTGAPTLLGDRLPIRIPAEFELLTILFVFAALFLGEFHSYYLRYWWWDIALHSVSGLLLGIVGFLLVYVLNESRRIDLHMRAGFVALFAFAFAVTVGTAWEIFEFSVDQLLGTQMQKPMLGDPCGLTDTMWDLIVDALGAAVISGFGWWRMVRNSPSFIEAWIDRFVERNPRFFKD
ncbi:hypothetical protein [Rhodoferax antarcticus]|nr:hypothetical protein [Rhodoferax antarcticus]MCW2313006.1 putative membrane protein YjdF [Rhodoferax antarcticus]